MRKWDVHIQRVPAGTNGRPTELDALLDAGWEPFGFADHGAFHVALRRRRHEEAAGTDDVEEEEPASPLLSDEIFLP